MLVVLGHVMKKVVLLIILLNMPTIATGKMSTLDKYFNNRNILLQMISVADYYIDNCYGLSDSGIGRYKQAFDALGVSRDILVNEVDHKCNKRLALVITSVCHSIQKMFLNPFL